MNVTVVVAHAPGARLPKLCGSGVPLTPPRAAVVSTTLLAVAVPLLHRVMVATLLLPLHESVEETLMRGAPAHAVLQTKVVLLITILSIRTPVAETLLSDAIRHFNWMFCPLAAAGRLIVESM